MKRSPCSKLIIISLVIFSIATISVISVIMAENTQSSSSSSTSSTAVYIVYTEEPAGGADPNSFHLSTLSSLLGCEEAAKNSLIYVYKNAATGFSAKLTPEQVSQLEKHPGVLQVVKSKPVKLHGGGGAKNMKN
ncbi:subtilisin-like protease SBT5.6 [Silene latifolia]|uniref:subtilisin-like protease SBT5.6 n=1 Tax=Silene latifolia TaxID=37657 RepID=UPI003D76C465